MNDGANGDQDANAAGTAAGQEPAAAPEQAAGDDISLRGVGRTSLEGVATRAGFAALIGAPNAGKSTLVNQLVGAKVSIVSRKVQTTRSRIRGIYLDGAAQVVLVDTPGIFAPKRRLDRAMVEAAWSGAREADVVALLIDAARGVDGDVERILANLGRIGAPVLLVLNKVDRIEKERLLSLAADLNARTRFEETFMISALTGSGVGELRERFSSLMPFGPWLYPEDELSDAPMRQLAAEVTREKLYHRLHQELPYVSTVETTLWKELRGGAVRIEQTIFVERESQREIVLGKGGRTIKQISMDARAEIKEIIGAEAHLFLFVKVRENWGDDPERYREMGLEFPKD
ncbi:MAG: GTPase Era [Rhizobiales bacterium]|nr:GTPase Era [Hyphomicrobiales bacterium]